MALVTALALVACRQEHETFEAREIRRDLCAQPLPEGTSGAGSGEPRIAIVAPSKKLKTDKQSLPTIVVPPGSSIELAVDVEPREGTGRLLLDGLVGASEEAWSALEEHAPGTVQLTLRVDGETRAAAELKHGDDIDWRPLAGATSDPAQLEVQSDSIIELRASASSQLADMDLEIGFARLRVVEHCMREVVPPSPQAPNVVLFVMDTLRADRVGAYGYERGTTPNVDGLAERGALFEQAYSTAPWTWPSTASILTGRMPAGHGVTDSRNSYLSSELETIAESFQRAGVRTAAFVGNPLIVPQRNFDQGFGHFRHTRATELLDADVLVPEAIDWIRENAEGRFFVYVQAMDPHEPHEFLNEARDLFPAKRPFDYPKEGMVSVRTRVLRKQPLFREDGVSRLAEGITPEELAFAKTTYDRAVFTGDRYFGRLVDNLRVLGLLESTVIAFTSDHGEEFLEHGGVLHGQTLYEEVVRVPLVLTGPGVPRGVSISRPVSNRRLPATLAELAGVPFDAGEPLPSLFADSAGPGTDVRFTNRHGIWNQDSGVRQLGVRDGDWTLHFAPNGRAFDTEVLPVGATDPARTRLFDLASDPEQLADLADPEAAHIGGLLDRLLESEAEDALLRPASVEGAGEDTLQMLRDLGYLDG